MKKKLPSGKVVLTASGLAVLCLAVLAGAWFLTREPESDFSPASEQTGNSAGSWTENAAPDPGMSPSVSDTPEETVTVPTEPTEEESSSPTRTQTVLSEGESEVTSDLSGSTLQEENVSEAPAESLPLPEILPIRKPIRSIRILPLKRRSRPRLPLIPKQLIRSLGNLLLPLRNRMDPLQVRIPTTLVRYTTLSSAGSL